MNESILREKKVLPLIISMSLPAVISMLVNSLYNIVDSYFVAQISEEAMTALSLVYPIQIFITAVCVGYGVGINAIAAFYLGAKNSHKANDTATSGLVYSCIHGVLLTLLCMGGVSSFLHLFTNDSVVIHYALSYAYIVFSVAFFSSVSIAMEKIFQAEGNMVITMVSMVTGCLTNVILDPILIFGWGFIPSMGIKGAAIATAFSQVIPFVIYFIFYAQHPELPLRIQFRKEMFARDLAKKVYAVGIPAILNMALPSVLITVLNGILASFSEVYILILGIYYKLQTFIYLTANGIIQGIRPIVGFNYGARQFKRVREVFTTSLCLELGVMLIGTVICFLFAPQLIGLFTTNHASMELGVQALHIISIGFIVSAISVTICGTLEGLGRGFASLFVSILRYTLLIIPAAYLLSSWLGAVGVWHAFWITEVLAGAISAWIYRAYISKKVLSGK